MSPQPSRHRYARRLAAAAAVTILSACSAATTAPAEDVANNVVQSPLHDVTIRFDSITVMGTCDNNSLFETREDGEFELEFQVWNAAGTSMDWSRKPYGPLKKGTHRIPFVATVRRDVSMDTGLRVHFWASEKDGLLGNDPDMSRKNRWMTHQYDGSGWTGGRKIELVGGEASQCGVRLIYSITSKPV